MANYYVPSDTAGQITRGFSVLADALFPDPAREAQALYYASGARNNAARAAAAERAAAAQAEARRLAESGADGGAILAPLFETDASIMTAAPALARGVIAMRPGMTPRSNEVVMAQLGAGQNYATTAPGVDEENARLLQQSRIAVGPQYAALTEARRAREQALVTMFRPDGTPILVRNVDVGTSRVPADAVPVVAPDQVQGNVSARLAQGQNVPNAMMVLAPAQIAANAGALAREATAPVMVVGPQGVRTVPRDARAPNEVIVPNADLTDAAAMAALVGSPIDQDRITAAAQAAQLLAARNVPHTTRPIDISPTEAQAIGLEIEHQLRQIFGVDYPVDPDFLSRLTAQATQEYQRTRNAGMAVETVMAPIRANKDAYAEVEGEWNPVKRNIIRGKPSANLPPPPTDQPASPPSQVPLVPLNLPPAPLVPNPANSLFGSSFAVPGSPAVPPGYTPIGRAGDGTNRIVYRDAQGNLFAAPAGP